MDEDAGVVIRADEDVEVTSRADEDVVVAEITILSIATRLVETTVLPAGQFETSEEHEVTVNTSVEKGVTVTWPPWVEEATEVVIKADEDVELTTRAVEDVEVATKADEDVVVAEMTVLPIGTRLVETTVLPAGQFETSEEHEVTVNTSVENRVTVTTPPRAVLEIDVKVGVALTEMTVEPTGTRLVETTVLPAGQFDTSEEHDVTVNTSVEKRVTVTTPPPRAVELEDDVVVAAAA